LGQTYNHPWAAAVPLRLIHHIQDWVRLDRTPNQSMVGRTNSQKKTRVQKFENTPFSFGDVTNGDAKGCNEHPGSFYDWIVRGCIIHRKYLTGTCHTGKKHTCMYGTYVKVQHYPIPFHSAEVTVRAFS
jgi:hypothetical protein